MQQNDTCTHPHTHTCNTNTHTRNTGGHTNAHTKRTPWESAHTHTLTKLHEHRHTYTHIRLQSPLLSALLATFHSLPAIPPFLSFLISNFLLFYLCYSLPLRSTHTNQCMSPTTSTLSGLRYDVMILLCCISPFWISSSLDHVIMYHLPTIHFEITWCKLNQNNLILVSRDANLWLVGNQWYQHCTPEKVNSYYLAMLSCTINHVTSK